MTVKTVPDTAADAANAEIRHQFETLKGDLAALSAAVMALATTMKDKGTMAAADGATFLADQGKTGLGNVEARWGTFFQDMAKSVREKPLKALAVTAAIGMVFGFFTAPRR